jgi:DNA-directed RNA polymerase specialized sigma24 family protein
MSISSTADAPMSDQTGSLTDPLRQHYASVYRLALASLEDAKAARQAALRAFAETWLQDAQHPAAHPEQGLYALALKRLPRKAPGEPTAPPAIGESEPDASWLLDPAIVQFNRSVDRLGMLEHRLLVLVYVLGWTPAQAAALLGVSQSAALAQLSLFHTRLCPQLEKAPESAIPPGGILPPLPGEMGASADHRAAAVLQARWPAPAIDEAGLEDLSRQVEELAESLRRQQAKSAPFRRLTVIFSVAAVLLLCLTAGLGGYLLNAYGLSSVAPATPSATAHGAPTAFPKITPAPPLTRRSSDEDIRQRWAESPRLWHSLSADLQTWRYGPLSYSGLPRAYRAQTWILQPDQSIVLSGLLGGETGQSYLAAQNRIFWRSAAENETSSQPWDGSLESLVPEGPVRQMIFPASSPWASRQGSFRGVQTTELAGRKAVVFDWRNPDGQREARLWLDDQTGIILRAQVFGGHDFNTLIDESILTTLALENSQPPPALITGARLGQAQSVSGDPAFAALPPTPTPATNPSDRAGIASEPAPPGFDPSGGRLAFKFPGDPQVANAAEDTAAQPVELLADGYSLGMTRFGLPWMLRCDRSPDGRRLAFNTGSDGAAPADDSLRWFNLSKPVAIYQPLPDLHAVSFAFAPDSRRLAVAGQGSGDRTSGVYLVDIGTGESRLLLATEQAYSLLWSPDGEFLALVGQTAGMDEPAILVLHVRTNQIAYRGEPGIINELPADSPIAAWGLPFPVEMGGMDACAEPQLP